MSDESTNPGRDSEKTARLVGQLVKYSREVNQANSVDEVATYALEAVFHVLDGHPSPTVVGVAGETPRVLESMHPESDTGEQPGPVAEYAQATGETVVQAPEGTPVEYAEEVTVRPVETDDDGVTVAAPSVYTDEVGDVGVVLVSRWTDLEGVAEHHVRPLEYLADHVATSVTNIRSRERLERARNDLARRKEMVEVYDRLLRHDLGNDLQVISGFSEVLGETVESDQAAEYVEKIHSTARSATALVEDVGEVVKTLQEEGDPEPQDLRETVETAVEETEPKFDSLTVRQDVDGVDGEVFAGELLDSIFSNILSNAAVHNDEPVTVDVYAEEPTPETVVVGFADDGGGVPEAVRDEVFEMGQKGPDSDGTGFGLGLARTLTEFYGGGIELGESPAGGAEFRVTLRRP